MMRNRVAHLAALLATALVALVAWRAHAQRRPINAPVGAGNVNLPYTVADGSGNQWRIYQGGWLQQSGNMPLYSQGAMLMVNGAQPNVNNNMARLDNATGEVVFENMQAQGGFSVTRRVLVDKEIGFVRYIDVIKNNTAQEQTVNLQLSSNFNYGLQNGQNVPDPKRKGQDVGWVGQTHANGMTVVEVYAGKGSKLAPSLNGQVNNNVAMATFQLPIKAGKEAAILHLHATAASLDAGIQAVNNVKEKDLLKSIPRELRKILVNVATTQSFVTEVEVLRGDLLDVVELKTGDQFKGTLKEQNFALDTFYGPVQLPVDKVVGLTNTGRFRPRQLVITSDGQIFGGTLKKQTVDLQLSSGQVTQIPLQQVARVGYRKREGEPEEWTFDKPIVLMRSGERVGVKMPSAPVEAITRYGKISLKPETVAAIVLQSEDSGVHEFYLTDGSKFSGLLLADQLNMVLDAPGAEGKEQAISFPTSQVARIQLAGKVAEQDDSTATLELTNDDTLVGTLSGKLELATAFDTIAVNANEVKSLTRLGETASDVSVTLWDGTSLSGQVQGQALNVSLSGGGAMTVPLAVVVKYEQPQPQPSNQMVDKIREVIADLNADDWKKRDRAQAALVNMGPVAGGVLKKMRDAQPPEAQQRIDAILKELDKQKPGRPTAGAAAPGAGAALQGGVMIDN
jgi:hypothetical protein